MAIPILSGRFPVFLLPIAASVLAGLTIIICYVIAVQNGDVEPFPDTDITHCAKYAPESFIFRVGIIPACVLLMVGYLLMHQWVRGQELINDGHTPRRKCCISLTSIACLCGSAGAVFLIVSSAVIEPDDTPWTLHIAFAIAFFVCSAVSQLLITFKLCLLYNEYPSNSLTSIWSLAIKVICNGCLLMFLGLFVGADFLKSKLILDPLQTTELKNAMEWMLVADILLYSMTFALDWYGKAFQTLMVPQPMMERGLVGGGTVFVPLVDDGVI